MTTSISDRSVVLNHVGNTSLNVTVPQSQKAYEVWAPTYNADLEKTGFVGPKLTSDYVCKVVPQNERATCKILDVGAGTGLVAKHLRDNGFKMIDALEPSDPMLNEARKENLYNNYFVEYITKDATDHPANSYDGISGCGIYGKDAHVPFDALYEMIRLVKPGGYITLVTRAMLLDTPNYKTLEPLMARLEKEGKWKKVARDIVGKLYSNFDAIVWQYQKC